MNKSTFFAGQPIFSQLISLLPREGIRRAVRTCNSDYYYKKFDTYHHLITMLYAAYQHCTSLREVVTGMRACEGRLQSTGIKHLPARSTLSEANRYRSYEVFEQIYGHLVARYSKFLPDSRKDKLSGKLVIIDSTTISLFKEVLKSAGCKKQDGRRKGGIKVHMAVRAHEDIPYLVRFTAGAAADVSFLKHIHLPAGSIAVMDRGYSSFSKYNEWTGKQVNWVTRLSDHNVYTVLKDKSINQSQKNEGIISDQHIILGFAKKKERVKCRLVKYFDADTNKIFLFITNNYKWAALKVAAIYKRRWQIELLFKRLKQNMPLQYFLGDNENAIKLQIYATLIADLLLKLATIGIKRHWAFSNLASFIRLHLMNYTSLKNFLEYPDKARISNPVPIFTPQLSLNLSG
jgi:hypothetical protein